MSRKSKGISAERELLHKFWQTGQWIALRVPASGSMKYPCPDLLVGNLLRKLAIECKTTKATAQYISQEQVDNLQYFSTVFGAEPFIAVKFQGDKWYFLTLEDVEQTKAGNYCISKELAQRKGLLFEEVIETEVKPAFIKTIGDTKKEKSVEGDDTTRRYEVNQ